MPTKCVLDHCTERLRKKEVAVSCLGGRRLENQLLYHRRSSNGSRPSHLSSVRLRWSIIAYGPSQREKLPLARGIAGEIARGAEKSEPPRHRLRIAVESERDGGAAARVKYSRSDAYKPLQATETRLFPRRRVGRGVERGRNIERPASIAE
jgi:hypothetical protein